MPHAEVQCLASRGVQADLQLIIQRTDADGTFSIGGLHAKEMLALRARTDRAVSDVTELRPAEASGPVRIKVSPTKVFVIRGVCLDTAGQPVRRAEMIPSGRLDAGADGPGLRRRPLRHRRRGPV